MYQYKAARSEFEKTEKTFTANKALLAPKVNDSLFCWLDVLAQAEVRRFLDTKIEHYPAQYPPGCNTGIDDPDSFMNWNLSRLQKFLYEALFNTAYVPSADDVRDDDLSHQQGPEVQKFVKLKL